MVRPRRRREPLPHPQRCHAEPMSHATEPTRRREQRQSRDDGQTQTYHHSVPISFDGPDYFRRDPAAVEREALGLGGATGQEAGALGAEKREVAGNLGSFVEQRFIRRSRVLWAALNSDPPFTALILQGNDHRPAHSRPTS